ncbi:MAG: hypothetical protein WC547_03235 [Candidatus Omnitrophota bacterium]
MRYITGFFLILIVICFSQSAQAESIVLRSGKTIEGQILEKTDDYIKVDYKPSPLYYYWDSIDSIDGQTVPGRAQKAQPQEAALTAGSGDRELKELLDARDKEIESLRAQLKDTEQARADFAVLKQAFKRLQAKYYNNLGGTFLYEKAFENAAAAFQEALDIDPWNPEACFNMALLYDNYMKDAKAAVSFYERYLVLMPDARDRQQIEDRIAKLKN